MRNFLFLLFILIYLLIVLPSTLFAQENEPFLSQLEVMTAENFHRIEQVRIIEPDPTYHNIISLDFDPSGNTLAVGTSFNHTYLYLVETGEQIGLFQQEFNDIWAVTTLDFSPDASLLAVGGGDGLFHLWNVQTQTEIFSAWHASGAHITTAVRFSPNGQSLAEGGTDGIINLWDVETGVQLMTFVRSGEGYAGVDDILFSPDGETLISCGSLAFEGGHYAGYIQFWQTSSGAELFTLTDDSLGTDSITLLTEENQLVSVGARSVTLWDLETQTDISTFNGDMPLSVLAVSPNAELIAATGSAPEYGEAVPIHLWYIEDETERFDLEGHTWDVRDLAFNSQGTLLASASFDGTVRLWGVPSTEG